MKETQMNKQNDNHPSDGNVLWSSCCGESGGGFGAAACGVAPPVAPPRPPLPRPPPPPPRAILAPVPRPPRCDESAPLGVNVLPSSAAGATGGGGVSFCSASRHGECASGGVCCSCCSPALATDVGCGVCRDRCCCCCGWFLGVPPPPPPLGARDEVSPVSFMGCAGIGAMGGERLPDGVCDSGGVTIATPVAVVIATTGEE